MKQLLARLREFERQFKAAETVGTRSAMGGHIVGQLPQLLDRLEKLEKVAEQVENLRLTKRYGSYHEAEERIEYLFKTLDALAALDGDNGQTQT